MKILSLLSLLLFSTVVSVVLADFPSKDVQQCKLNDNSCVVDTVNKNIFAKFSSGLSSLGLPSIEPLKVNKLNIEQGGNGPITIKLYFKDLAYSGFSQARMTKFEGPGDKLENGRFSMDLEAPVITQVGAYKINGKVLVLPIQGTGQSNMTFERPILKFRATTKSVMKNGEEYMQVDRVKINIVPSRLYMDFSNLFNGQKELGDNMNLFLNANWKDIYGELKGAIQSSFSEVVKDVVNQVFMSAPYKKMFLP